MLNLLLLPLQSEGGGDAVAYVIGLGALFLLMAMIFALLAFGKGREHS